MIPWLFLFVTLVGAWFTFNAYLPQKRTGPLIVPSFFAGWLTSELSAHHFAWQVAATVIFVLAGALEAWPGKVLWINFPSSVHLASVEKIKQTTRELIEAAAGTNRLIIGITEDVPEDRWQQSLLAISEVINSSS